MNSILLPNKLLPLYPKFIPIKLITKETIPIINTGVIIDILSREKENPIAKASMLVAKDKITRVCMPKGHFWFLSQFRSSNLKLSYIIFAPMKRRRENAIQWSNFCIYSTKPFPARYPTIGIILWKNPKKKDILNKFLKLKNFIVPPLEMLTAKQSKERLKAISIISMKLIE